MAVGAGAIKADLDGERQRLELAQAFEAGPRQEDAVSQYGGGQAFGRVAQAIEDVWQQKRLTPREEALFDASPACFVDQAAEVFQWDRPARGPGRR